MTFSFPIGKSPPVADPQAEARPRERSGAHCVLMPQARGWNVSITVKPLAGEGIMEVFNRLGMALKETQATIVLLVVFGDVAAGAAGTEAMRRIFGDIEWPVTWVEGAACDGGCIAGLQAFGFAGGEVHRVRMGRRVVGSVFEDGAFRHCVLGGLAPGHISRRRGDQTKQVLEHLAEGLAHGGLALADVARTWFFLDNMLAWYGEFNQARTRAYSGVKFRTGSLPASTGIGARNPAAAALVAGAWALRPLNAAARVEEIASPLQCPAPAYGSAFSRAMEMSSPAGRRLFISGTASIARDGRTLWPEDARKQVAQTMQAVEAILESRGFSLPDLARGTAYFKRRGDVRAFTEWCAAHSRFSQSVVLANCDVCRDDLLFELEVDAWRPGGCAAT